ncbi:sulfotransferase-like domain-containing protein [Ideonella paludis]|uniref:HAD family hydrolase n=1 Tax=Ideonella paludis TaxID=1233411 RepID=A0ABS5DVP0_9BURK|nr:HAD family hydrolase [Ideonella paludis]MBQ0935212.1 HAD family hydrolase [Ideonella paludis]
MTLRLAMWSGPRNISTAMMRAWENRPDCAVSDEPLYAAYLAQTGLDHPGRAEILAHGETDWRKVVTTLQGPAPDAKPIWYQKHMTHHLLPSMAVDWIHGLTNVLLIRAPDQVVESYLKSRAEVAPEDIGLLQQVTLFEAIEAQTGHAPLVIDVDDFLQQPSAYLQALCEHLGIAFMPSMLSWPAGPRPSDGIWAPHWYDAVWRSTGFEPWRPRQPQLSGQGLAVAKACEPAYARLHAARLRLA